MPVDILFRQAVQAGQLRAGCFFPFVSTIDLIQSEASTINESRPHDSVLMTALLRYSFFVDRDLAGSAMPALAGILERTPSLETDLHLKLIHGAMGFLLSERYQNF